MIWILAVVMLGLMFMGTGFRVDPALMFFICVFLMMWMGVKVMVGLLRWVGGSDPKRLPPASRNASPLRAARKVCADPRCGITNPARARFCSQCGKALS